MKKLAPSLLFLVLLAGCVGSEAAGATTRVFLIGDSTMAIKRDDERPETGWGERLGNYMKPEVEIFNHAVNGRSSRSFRAEGRWQKVLEQLQRGDYVFIQFGHNDEKEQDPERYTNPYGSYRDYLRRYVEDARARGAEPLLLSSIVRRNFNDAGTLIDSHGPYPAVMRQLAQEMAVDFVDMNTLSEQLVFERGKGGSKALYLHLPAGAHPNYPNGIEDNTHFNPVGADVMARLVADDLCRQQHPLNRYLTVCTEDSAR